MSTSTPATPTAAPTQIKGMPEPGPGRFWLGSHLPANVKTPFLLELREKTNSGDRINVSFSRLIGKQPTIADEKAIIQAASDILVRAGQVDEFVGFIEAAK